MRDDADAYFAQPRGMLELWGALGLGPVAWILHQQSSYLLVYWACGTGHVFVFHLATVLLLLLAGFGAYLGWRAWNDAGAERPDDGGSVADRSRFMAMCGIVLSGGFSVVILAQWVPALVIDPCIR